MLVPNFRDSAAALRANGYLPVPIAPHSKRPLIERWTTFEFQAGDELKYPPDAGVGVGSPLNNKGANPISAKKTKRRGFIKRLSC